jgi:hypothetical protein
MKIIYTQRTSEGRITTKKQQNVASPKMGQNAQSTSKKSGGSLTTFPSKN